MVSKNKNIFSKNSIIFKTFKWFILPALLLILWISLSLLYSSYRSFTVLQYAHYLNKSDNFNTTKLLKGHKITGMFTALENHLGIIAVRFGDAPRTDYDKEDILDFKLKEYGSNNWLAFNKYRSGAIISGQYYPLGFNEIDKSRGEKYVFEISSERGNSENAITISLENPVYLTKYKFSKNEILSNVNSFTTFLFKKLITFFTNYEALFSSTVFLLPFIFYVLWVVFPVDSLIKSDGKITGRKLFQAFVGILIFSDCLFYEFINSGFMLAIIGLWIFSLYINKSKSKITYVISFFLVVISVLSVYLNLNVSYDKTSAFAYLLLLIAFSQTVYEHRLNTKRSSRRHFK